MTEQLLDTHDLARVLKISGGTVRNRMSLARKAGVAPDLPPAIRVGSLPRWLPADVQAWLEAKREGRELQVAG